MFRLLVRAHAYLKLDSGPRCVVVLRQAGQNNACVHWTSPQSLICAVIRGETQPTRLRLSSCSPPPFPSPHPCFLPAAKSSEGARSDSVQQQRLQLLVVPRLKFPSAAQRSDSKLTLHREELSERHHIETLSSTRVYKLPRPARVLTVCVLCYSD